MTLYSWCFYREIIRPAKTILILKWQKNNIFLLFSMILYSTLQATTGLFLVWLLVFYSHYGLGESH